MRGVARDLAIRANFRLGTGDVDGALDDVRSIWRLGRALIETPTAGFVERLVAISILETGANVDIFAAPGTKPTAKQTRRFAEIRRETFETIDFDAAFESATQAEFERPYLATAQHFTSYPPIDLLDALRRLCDDVSFYSGGKYDPQAIDVIFGPPRSFERRSKSFAVFRKFDSNRFMKRVVENWRRNLLSNVEFNVRRGSLADAASFDFWQSVPRNEREIVYADFWSQIMLSNVDGVRDAFRRAQKIAEKAPDDASNLSETSSTEVQ